MVHVTNTRKSEWATVSARGQSFEVLDLGGEQIGARFETLAPGGTSSEHHFHTAEEEHILLLEGAATLVLDTEEIELSAMDHVVCPANERIGHHLVNRADGPCTYLVYGERRLHDVVSYPRKDAILVKSLGDRVIHGSGD